MREANDLVFRHAGINPVSFSLITRYAADPL
jgi:hypothetical protein